MGPHATRRRFEPEERPARHYPVSTPLRHGNRDQHQEGGTSRQRGPSPESRQMQHSSLAFPTLQAPFASRSTSTR